MVARCESSDMAATAATQDAWRSPLHNLRPLARGFLFVGIGGRDWCADLRQIVGVMRLASLRCFRDAMPCLVHFIGDDAGAASVRRGGCESLLSSNVTTANFARDCYSRAGSSTPWLAKLCVRALRLSPFEHTILLDFDTLILSNEIEQIFHVLSSGFDLTTAMECCAIPDKIPRTPHMLEVMRVPLVHGWEMHTGVVGFTRAPAVSEHASIALAIWRNSSRIRRYSSYEQQAETMALTLSTVRWLPLPPTFAIRSYSATAWRQLPRAVAHWKWRTPRTANATAAHLLAEARAWADRTVRGISPTFNTLPISEGFNISSWWTRWHFP